jgi:hypothetical protein
MQSQCIILYDHQRREDAKCLCYTIRISTILFQDVGVADLAYTVEVTQVDNNRESQLLLYTGSFNATCFGVTRRHHQANKTQKKLKLMKTSR